MALPGDSIMLHCYLWVSLLCCERYIFLYTVVPNLVSFVTFIAEIAHGEKSRTQSITQSLTHSAYLMPQEPKRLHFGITYCDCTIWNSTVKHSTPHINGHFWDKLPSQLLNWCKNLAKNWNQITTQKPIQQLQNAKYIQTKLWKMKLKLCLGKFMPSSQEMDQAYSTAPRALMG